MAMLVCMLPLAGMPPTAGFAGKLALFGAAVNAGYVWLAILGVTNSLLSVAYYFGVLVQMYMAEGSSAATASVRRPALTATVLVTMLLVLVVGLAPSGLLALATAAVASLR